METTNYTYKGIDFVILHEQGQGFEATGIINGTKHSHKSSTREQVKNMFKKTIKRKLPHDNEPSL